MFAAGDLVQVNDAAIIVSLRGSLGVVIRNLGIDPTQSQSSADKGFYYEVNLAANGSQILMGKELDLISKGRKK